MKDIVKQLKDARHKHVVIVGDVMLDEYIFGEVERISPEAPVAVLREGENEWSLGGAANVALNCKHIGCNVDLVGVVGSDDIAGEKILTALERSGISTKSILKSIHRKTTSKKRIMTQHHQLLRVDREDTHDLSYDEQDCILAAIDASILPGSVVVISDYAKGVLNTRVIRHIVAHARQHGCVVLVDPKGPDFSKYHGAAYMKPNLKEFRQIVKFFKLPGEASVIENGRRICELLHLEGLIVTMGDQGIQFVSARESFLVPSIEREVFDLSGAGDTVIAFLALSFACSISMEKALRLSAQAAAVAISHLKTYAVSLDELVDTRDDFSKKTFKELATLKIELDWLKRDGKRVVFIAGSFDRLDAKATRLLADAKSRGDVLVVGLLHSDQSSFEDRSTVLASLATVDFVVACNSLLPDATLTYLRPDVLVAFNTHDKCNGSGHKHVAAYGGRVDVIAQ